MKIRTLMLACMALSSGAAYAQSSEEPGPARVNLAVPVAPLPLSVALKAAQTAMQTCNALGLAPTVTYVDREGVTRVVLVSDGAGALGSTTSQRKAYTSASLGIPTEKFREALIAQHLNSTDLATELIIFNGGFPIFRKGVLVGGIGVGGAEAPGYPGSADSRCALAGLAAIKADLDK